MYNNISILFSWGYIFYLDQIFHKHFFFQWKITNLFCCLEFWRMSKIKSNVKKKLIKSAIVKTNAEANIETQIGGTHEHIHIGVDRIYTDNDNKFFGGHRWKG